MIYVLRYALIGLYTVFWGSAALVMAFADRSGASVIWIARTWLRWVMRSCGIRVATDPLEVRGQAIQSGAPIIPVSVSGSWRITPKKTLRVESGRILIRYGKPIPTRDLTIEDRAYPKQQVREAIVAGFDPELQGPASRG